MFISFYQLIQLDPSMIRRMMGQTEDREERRRLRIAMITRSALIVVFAILFIGLMTSLFDAENSSMAVSIFCILLASRFVGFGYRISDSLFSMALCFLVLLAGPVLAVMIPGFFWTLLVNFGCLCLIVLMTCENPEMGNGGLYTFAYIFLSGNPVQGEAFLNRFYMTLLGFALCGLVLWRNHAGQNRERTFVSILKGYSLRNPKYQWQLRLTLGVTLLLSLFSTLGLTRYMWAGFACGSLLSDVEVENRIHEKLRDRVIGAAAGSALFYVIWSLLPASFIPLLGPVGGLCLGLCTEYRHKTMLNCFGALSLAAGMYGLKGAVWLRIVMTLLGVLFALVFFWLFDHFILSKLEEKAGEEKPAA
ncbi:FUSC family protein [uncultured Faecalibaculum sp.]|nr:FUSC family protein [uncultured Faecalibaculum sp.]